MAIPILGQKKKEQVAAEAARTAIEQIAKHAAATFCLEVTGPMAKLFAEFMERQAALEDAIWYCGNPACRVVTFGDREGGPCTACGEHASRMQYRYVPKGESAEPSAPEALIEVQREGQPA